ncbi:MAG: DUF1592 domain-containing protein [Verrucomicrobiota bacterium]
MAKSFLPSLLSFVLSGGSFAWADVHEDWVADLELFDASCLDCHDDLTTEAGLNLLDLTFDPADPHNLALWTKIRDRVTAGEMPPPEKPRPSPNHLQAFADATHQALTQAYEARYKDQGRVVGRRLNPTEYEHTLRDLLQAPWLQLKDMLPPDATVQGFDNVASAQEISYVQMARYLEAAEVAIDEAMRLGPVPQPTTLRTWFSEEGRYLGKGEFAGQGTGRNRPVGDWLVLLRQPNSAQAPFRIAKRSHKEPGWYRFRVRCRAVLYDNGELKPPTRGHVASIQTAAKRLLGRFDVPEGPEGGVVEFIAWQGQDELLQFYVETLDDRDFKRDQPKSPYRGDGVAVDWFELEGPFPNPECEADPSKRHWPSPSYRTLFGDLPLAPWTPASGLKEPELLHLPDLTANKWGLRESFQPPGENYMVVSEDPAGDAERLLRDFLTRAYRRPPDESEVQRCLTFALTAIEETSCFQDAMRLAYKAALCSPDFLYLRENRGPLNDYALASRLSYLLWRSQPDQALFEAANRGELQFDKGLLREFDRLLADPKSSRFVSDFCAQWLDLHKVHETSPDRFLFPEYFCDTHAVDSAVAETEATFAEMLHRDLPAITAVDADFVSINERLARLYDLPPLRGRSIRQVPLPEGSPRGGFLTQASVLKVTANGLATSPVIRGAWVIDRLLGQAASAPPPDAGAVEPDTRGTTTIRELLDQHRNVESCASCHRSIDPPGFALESFDVMGAWRDHYRSFEKGEPVSFTVANRPVRYKTALPVDPSGTTVDGHPFSDIHDLRQYLLTQEEQIARNLVERLLTFATGAAVSYADRALVESILQQTASQPYGVRSLLRTIVLSETFRSK